MSHLNDLIEHGKKRHAALRDSLKRTSDLTMMRKFLPGVPKIRQVTAIVFVLACLGTVFWAIAISYQEETTDWFLNLSSSREDPKIYRVNLLSVDEVAGKAQASVQVVVNKYAFVSSPKMKGPINGKFLAADLDLRVGPVGVQDLAPLFESVGFLVLTTLSEVTPKSPDASYTTNAPPLSQVEFSLLGQPKFYPFDKYLVVGYVHSIVLASADKKTNKKDFFSLEDSHTEVYLRAPNFVMRGAPDQELLSSNSLSVSAEGLQLEGNLLKDNGENRKKIFAVALERPFFLRFSTIFLLVIALGSMIYYAIVSDARAFALQALGYFVGLWAIRQMLGTGGPKVFTVIDYVILLLYAGVAATLVAKELWISNRKEPTKA